MMARKGASSLCDMKLLKLAAAVFLLTVLVSATLLFTMSPNGHNVFSEITNQVFDTRTPIARLVANLKQENAKLKEELAQKNAMLVKMTGVDTESELSTKHRGPEPVANVSIDMMNFLGTHTYFSGISWDPFVCYPPPKTTWGADLDADSAHGIETRLVEELSTVLSDLLKIPKEKLNTSAPYHEPELGVKYNYADPAEPYRKMLRDPKFAMWKEKMMVVLSKYLTYANKTMYITCDGVTPEMEVPPSRLGVDEFCSKKVSSTDIIEKMGFYGVPWESIKEIAQGFLNNGMCTAHVRKHHLSYANWLAEERMYSPKWFTFPVENFDQDAVVFLFDVLYEKMMIFQRQYWLGTITMQNPFDMYAIQDIIFTVKPKLIIEAGTANGGSALLWSSILELCSLEESRIVTLDVQAPSWSKDEYHWGGVAREDPTKHKLWQKHVVFIKGSTADKKVIEEVDTLAKASPKTMVLLDSSHASHHVAEEMEIYCPMVSIGSFCIIQDTKMSRWSSDGPLTSVLKFLEKHPEFEMDRSRELLYTHHAMGYLKRVK